MYRVRGQYTMGGPRILLGGKTLVPLLGNAELETLALRQRDVGLVALA